MKLLADRNIVAAEQYFGAVGELRQQSGRAISAQDLQDVDVLLVRSVTRVDRHLLRGSPVRFVGSCTTGVDHIDLDYLASEDIVFAHAPGANARSVVEYVLSALCHLSRRRRVEPGMSVGIVGLGNIGSRLYQLLETIGFACMAYDPLIPVRPGVRLLPRLEPVLAADIISLHTPLTRGEPHGTWHMLDAHRLAALPRNALLINSSRGAVVDNRALGDLLQRRSDLAVVLDVWEHEPSIDLALMAQVDLATPHIAGYSYDGKLRGTQMVAQALYRWQGIAPPPDPVAEAQGDPLASVSDWERLCQQMLSVYDIFQDDQRLRHALADGADTAAAFEQLRTQYPVRREAKSFKL